MRRALLSTMAVVLAWLGLAVTGCGGPPSTASVLRARLLSAADLPGGWAPAPANPPGVRADAPCLAGLTGDASGWTHATAAFVQGPAVPSLGELLATGPRAATRWRRINKAMASCHSATLTISGQRTTVTIRPLGFPRVGAASSAYQWAFTVNGVSFSAAFVAFSTGSYYGYVSYSGLGAPNVATVDVFADAAATKAATGTTPRVPDSVSITSEPVRTVATSQGTVAYRTIGRGQPLLLIMGYGATMSGWDPRFVNALATRYRVVIFDNAGVGRTAALPGTLTIDAMASQTSALVTALGLGKVNVLGWSMGSMIAQALAVSHPAQVKRLVLCASYPGDGSALRPSAAAISALNSGDQHAVMNDLFPADQAGAAGAYQAATSSYPAGDAAPAAVVAAQGKAVDAWWAGADPAGKRASQITAPTLIADGSADTLDPVGNTEALIGLINGSERRLYPDAGHAFLFQERETFVPAVESFLAGTAARNIVLRR